jgi:hypothetical protein
VPGVTQPLLVGSGQLRESGAFNAELQWPFQGVRVLVEDIHQRPATGDLIELEVDPVKPTMVRDPQSSRWSPWDLAFIALIPVGLVIAWARANRWLRNRRLSAGGSS